MSPVEYSPSRDGPADFAATTGGQPRHGRAAALRHVITFLARRALSRAETELLGLDDRTLADMGLDRRKVVAMFSAIGSPRNGTRLSGHGE